MPVSTQMPFIPTLVLSRGHQTSILQPDRAGALLPPPPPIRYRRMRRGWKIAGSCAFGVVGFRAQHGHALDSPPEQRQSKPSMCANPACSHMSPPSGSLYGDAPGAGAVGGETSAKLSGLQRLKDSASARLISRVPSAGE